MKKIYARIRWVYAAFMTAFILGFVMIPLSALFRSRASWIMHYFNKVIIKILGGKIEITGTRDPDANLFLFNHQSIIDIIAMEASEDVPWRWVAKKEVFNMPLYGHLLTLGNMIPVERDNKSSLISLLRHARESVETLHRPIVIAPEGTRARTQKLLPFKAGANLVANKLGLKVQPVVITGSRALLNEHDFTSSRSTVHITYLPSFYAKEAPKDWYEQTRKEMQAVIDKERELYGRER
jgi:1-acyl-sn-glycerol-3-phosphate acyltransferase